jgi:hypothetical protein
MAASPPQPRTATPREAIGAARSLLQSMAANNNPTTEVLAGPVERVTFHNEDNGFCVLRVKTRGKREHITVVGHAAVISAGEFIAAGIEPGALREALP